MATQTLHKCAKCNAPTKGGALWVVVAQTQKPFCQKCYINWLDIKDEVVAKAFKEYIGEDKVQSRNRSRG